MKPACKVCGGTAGKGGFLKLTRLVHGLFITSSLMGEPVCEGCMEWKHYLTYPRRLTGILLRDLFALDPFFMPQQ
jgi:hypothetical protein